MPTNTLFDPVTGKRNSQAPIVLRTILMTVLAIAILGSAIANGYFYFKYRETSVRLAEMQEDIRSLRNKGNGSDLSGIESALDEIDRKLDSIDTDLGSIDSDMD